VFHYAVTAEQGYLSVHLKRGDVSPFDPDFVTSSTLPLVIKASEEKTAAMTVPKSGQYKVEIYLWSFEGQVDIRWETR
jgi:hypothetical protein